MCDICRSIQEVISICQLEPTLKQVFVEGISDKLVIDRFLEKEQILGLNVYNIDLVRFEDEYSQLPDNLVKCLKDSNKERVIYLALKLEKMASSDSLLCIVDRDLDFELDNVRAGKYLIYTDYNSMELYLFHQVYIQALIKNTFRVTTHFDIASFTKSISEICKSLFFIRSYIAHESGTLVDIHKDLSYDRKTNVCSFNSESYLTKLIQRNKFTVSLEDFNNEIHNKIKNATEDVRLLIKGHDFIHILYECIRKHKKVSMSEDELANTFWVYLDSKQLRTEPLFQKIANL